MHCRLLSMKSKERQYMSDVAGIGCIVCRNLGEDESPANVHHIRTGNGAGQKSGNYLTIPLCHFHHQGGEGIHTLGTRVWQPKYGDELSLLNQTIGLVHEQR